MSKNKNKYYLILSNGGYVNSIKKDDVYFSTEEYELDYETMEKYSQRLNQMKIRYEVIKI